MALVKLGPMAAAVSGKIGGSVFSHNRGGAYVRAWAKPTVVTSAAAISAKIFLTACAQAWAGLTEGQKDAWRNWTLENPSVNRLGDSRTLSGHAAFNMLNTRVLRMGASLLTLPPLDNPPAPPALTSLTVDASAHTASLVFTPTPLPAGIHLWIWAALVDGAGISYVANRLRLVSTVDPAGTSPAAFGTDLEDRFGSLIEGQVCICRVQTADQTSGLVSAAMQIGSTVVA
jgi:hypothetical protein